MLRLDRTTLFFVLLTPLLVAGLLRYEAITDPVGRERMLNICLISSVFFAAFFTAWIIDILYRLAPSKIWRERIIWFLLIGIGYRVFMDWFTIDQIRSTGKAPEIESMPAVIPFHLAITLGVLTLLVFLGRWLVMREHNGRATKGWGWTSLLFIVFPVGIWFLQPRLQQLRNPA